MINDLTGLCIGIGPMLAVLFWCNLRDRRRDRANEVRADISAAANRALGGESMLAVEVEPAKGWRRGRVHLRTPGGYESLIAKVSGAVIQRLPNEYELVVHRAPARA